MALVGVNWHEFLGENVGKRGPKPVEMGTLNAWEFEWYKALHLLRDGMQLPKNLRWDAPPSWKPREAEARIKALTELNPTKIWDEMERQQQQRLLRPISEAERVLLHAKAEIGLQRLIDDEIVRLKQFLRAKQILKSRTERRAIWTALTRARNIPAVQQACQRWERLADVHAAGFTPYAVHVSANAQVFLRMKRDQRFPRSPYADNSRLEYLARGMAGVMMGVSPMTSIERLRNMKHAAGGPLWSDADKFCRCWRCETARYRDVLKALGAVVLPQGEERHQ
jgi:hypothetical protein